MRVAGVGHGEAHLVNLDLGFVQLSVVTSQSPGSKCRGARGNGPLLQPVQQEVLFCDSPSHDSPLVEVVRVGRTRFTFTSGIRGANP